MRKPDLVVKNLIALCRNLHEVLKAAKYYKVCSMAPPL